MSSCLHFWNTKVHSIAVLCFLLASGRTQPFLHPLLSLLFDSFHGLMHALDDNCELSLERINCKPTGKRQRVISNKIVSTGYHLVGICFALIVSSGLMRYIQIKQLS